MSGQIGSQRVVRATHVSWGHVFEAQTRDVRDHTFSGIAFDVECKAVLPTDCIEIASVSVRGDLGWMRVFVTDGGISGKLESPSAWREVYAAQHGPSMQDMVALRWQKPVVVRADEVVGIYVHSSRVEPSGPPDSVVYASQRHVVTCDSTLISILPGVAHTSAIPFSPRGYWPLGPSWRPHREFVGAVEFGCRWLCWNPRAEVHARFPPAFRRMVMTTLLCHARPGFLRCLPHAALFHVFNMCSWEWAYPSNDDPTEAFHRDQRDHRKKKHGDSDDDDSSSCSSSSKKLVACRDDFGTIVYVAPETARGALRGPRSRHYEDDDDLDLDDDDDDDDYYEDEVDAGDELEDDDATASFADFVAGYAADGLSIEQLIFEYIRQRIGTPATTTTAELEGEEEATEEEEEEEEEEEPI